MIQKFLFNTLMLASIGYLSSAQAATQVFSATGAAATTEFNNFKTAIKNATGADGNRIGWDGVKLDGTDANPNTKIIAAGKTVQIPVDRFKNVGAIFADPYTVSGDGFASVNPSSAGQFPAFSPSNTFAMFDLKDGQFDDRNIQQSFVLAGTDTVAGTRGFGVIFVDVELNNSASIEYFGKDANNNKVTLGKYYVQPSANGEPQFLGVLYDSAVIADVEVTVGSKALFSFDGKNIKAFGAENLSKGVDLVVTDDFFYAVPEALKASNDQLWANNCLFDWAEKNYAAYVYPAGASTKNYLAYTYRYYQGINTYLGVSSETKHVYYWPPYAGLLDLGEFSTWVIQAKCR